VSRFLDAFRASAAEVNSAISGVPCPENPEFPEKPATAGPNIPSEGGFRGSRDIRDYRGVKNKDHPPEVVEALALELAAKPGQRIIDREKAMEYYRGRALHTLDRYGAAGASLPLLND
jgi:hypothetical protein